MTKVAVVTRTKDRPLFLRRAIGSVHSQTYEDFVHVIVNDGGNALEVESVIDDFDESVRAKIQLFNRTESSCAPDTILTESVDRIDSKFFAIHDDDDTWDERFLEMTVKHLEANTESAAVVVRTDKLIEKIENGVIQQVKQSEWMPDLKVVNLYRQCIDNQLTPISTLFRRNSYEEVGKFDETLPVIGDWEFGVRLLLKYDVDFIDPGHPMAFYHHRIKSDGSFDNHDHRYYVNKVMNTYLRNELAEGKIGVGYIMSKLKYDQSYTASIVKRIVPSRVARLIKNRVKN